MQGTLSYIKLSVSAMHMPNDRLNNKSPELKKQLDARNTELHKVISERD